MMKRRSYPSHARAKQEQPAASFEQVATTLRVLAKLAPPRDPEMQFLRRRMLRGVFIPSCPAATAPSISLIVHGVSHVKPREGETLEPYLGRLADALVLAFVKQEFDAGRVAPPQVACRF